MAQAAALAQLRAEVAQLKATVEELAQRLGRNSRNSSQPPSADPPQATKRPRREPSGRRPGGQPGHEGQARALVPVEAVDVVIPVKPDAVPALSAPVARGGSPAPAPSGDGDPAGQAGRDGVSAAPVGAAPACGEATRAELPAGVPTGGFGPRVQAHHRAVHGGLSSVEADDADASWRTCLASPMSLGTIANLEQATVQALAEPVAEARAYVQAQPAAYLDETGWREGQQRAWLWTAVTAWVTVFVVRRSRGGKVAQELLGERFWGWLVTDRWSAYTWYPSWRRQLCWAHLLRDIEAMIDARRTVPRDRGSLAGAGPPDVPLVASGPRWHARPMRALPAICGRSGARWSGCWKRARRVGCPKTEGTCREILKRAAGLVDVRAP